MGRGNNHNFINCFYLPLEHQASAAARAEVHQPRRSSQVHSSREIEPSGAGAGGVERCSALLVPPQCFGLRQTARGHPATEGGRALQPRLAPRARLQGRLQVRLQGRLQATTHERPVTQLLLERLCRRAGVEGRRRVGAAPTATSAAAAAATSAAAAAVTAAVTAAAVGGRTPPVVGRAGGPWRRGGAVRGPLVKRERPPPAASPGRALLPRSRRALQPPLALPLALPAAQPAEGELSEQAASLRGPRAACCAVRAPRAPPAHDALVGGSCSC